MVATANVEDSIGDRLITICASLRTVFGTAIDTTYIYYTPAFQVASPSASLVLERPM